MLLMLASRDAGILHQLGITPGTVQRQHEQYKARAAWAATSPADKATKDRAAWRVWLKRYRARLQQETEGRGGDGPGVQVPLPDLASEGRERLGLRVLLDALGDDGGADFAGKVQHRLDEVAKFVIEAAAEFVEQFDEPGDRLLRTGVEHRHQALGRGGQRAGERGSGVLGVDRHTGLGAIADAAAGRVEDAPQADHVTRVVQHAQVGDEKADVGGGCALQ